MSNQTEDHQLSEEQKRQIRVARVRVTERVTSQVLLERMRQLEKWGKGDDAHSLTLDDSWNALDWHEMIADYNAWARRMACMGSWEKARNRYIQVAALAVAAVEAIDRLRT